MADRGFSNDELRLYELLQQFLALSDDADLAGRIILLGPTGQIVGDASLSATDIEDATDALIRLNISRTDAADGTRPAAPLPQSDDYPDLPAVDTHDTKLLVTQAEEFLKNGGTA